MNSPRPPPESDTIVFAIGSPITREAIPELCERVRLLLEDSHADVIVCDAGVLVDPDACTVDALARLQLIARRCGGRLRLRHACGELRDLLAFVGVGDVVPCVEELPPEPRGQAEQREQGLDVEEEGDPADPIA